MKKTFFLTLLLFSLSQLYSQVITIDAQFDDWANIPVQTDLSGSASNLDLLDFSVTNDDEYLYLRVKTAEEFGLMNPGYTNSQIHLYIDTDNNPNTGRSGNALGSELRILFGDKTMDFDYPQVGAFSGNLYNVGVHSGPTVTGNEFEIAIRRNVKPGGSHDLFMSDSINLHFWSTSGDFMPDVNTSFSYTFDQGPFAAYPVIDLAKSDPSHLRVMAYNVLRGGLIDQVRGESHERIVKAMKAQIIGFTETRGSPSDIKKLLDAWVPVSGGWYTDNVGTNTIASQYPITFAEPVYAGDTRAVAALIDLPDSEYATDIMVITAHPSCCGNDTDRQEQIDRIANYVIDAQASGGRVNIPANTPIAIIGDFNLVGWRQQLETLTKGDIVNSALYGLGSPFDWDGSDLDDASCLHPYQPAFFTWRNPSSQFAPGKLDYIFYTGSVMEEMKSFTLDTYEIPSATLTQWGLNRTDTDVASDHLPLFADFQLEPTTGLDELADRFTISPNPANEFLQIRREGNHPVHGEVLDIHGRVLMQFEMKTAEQVLDISTLSTGIYMLKLTSNGHKFHNKLLKK